MIQYIIIYYNIANSKGYVDLEKVEGRMEGREARRRIDVDIDIDIDTGGDIDVDIDIDIPPSSMCSILICLPT